MLDLRYFLYGKGPYCLKNTNFLTSPKNLKYDISIDDCTNFDSHNLITLEQLNSHYGTFKK